MGGKGAAARTEWNEEIEDSRKDNGEPLQASRCPESLHHSLSSTSGQTGVLRTVVEAFVRAVFNGWHDLTVGSCIGSKPGGDQPSR
jgi:hypothetical protein